MSAYTRFCSSVLFPLHERLKGHGSVPLRRELERTQWLSPVDLVDLQVGRLREFLTNAGLTVPYYRDLFARCGFRPQDLRSTADLSALPLLDKPTVRANTEALRSATAGKLIRYNTGGSSGEPLVFFMGVDRVDHDVAAKWRATRWWNVDIGDPEAVLWGSPVELGKQDRVKALRDGLFRSHLLPAFQMSDARMDEYLRVLEKLRPKMLFGYASALARLAAHAEKVGRDMTVLGVKVVFATGETLYPDQRVVIERMFSAPVANGYGSRDAGFIAHQCAQGSLHISAEHIIVEVVDAHGRPVPSGEQGEIVVTHMATRDYPFVRYRTGDMATLSDATCSCGRGLPVLKEVLGRSTDFVRTVSGDVMHALALIYTVRDKPGVRSFKFVQQADLSLDLMIVPSAGFSKNIEQDIRHDVLQRMGPGTQFAIRQVSEIPPEKSGKQRYVISNAAVSAP